MMQHEAVVARIRQLEAQLERLETRQRNRRSTRLRLVGAAAVALALGALVFATPVAWAQHLCTQTLPSPLVTFCPGSPARAADMNNNFATLLDWLENKVGPVGSNDVTASGAVSGSSLETTGAIKGASLTVTGTIEAQGGIKAPGLNVTGTLNAPQFMPGFADWNLSPQGGAGGAGILNDNASFRTLMIVGNNSAGGSRHVGLWDDVTVAGSLNVNGSQTVNGNLSANGLNGTLRGRVLPDYDSGWQRVTSNATYSFGHGLGAVPSDIVLQQCGAVSNGVCATRTAITGTRGYRDGSARINPVNMSADGNTIFLHHDDSWVWGVWDRTTGWACPGDDDNNCATGYYRILAWR